MASQLKLTLILRHCSTHVTPSGARYKGCEDATNINQMRCFTASKREALAHTRSEKYAPFSKTIDFLRCVYNDSQRTLSELCRRIDNMYTMVQNRNALWYTDETSSGINPEEVGQQVAKHHGY